MRFALLALLALSTPAFADGLVLSDSQDIFAYIQTSTPEARALEGARNNDMVLAGNSHLQSSFHFQSAPQKLSPFTSVVSAAALMSSPSGRLFFRKFQFKVNTFLRNLAEVRILKDIDLASMHFSVHAGLIDRMVVVEDAANGVTLAYPLGVGGIDEAVMGPNYRILTPKFHGATLNRASVQPARTDPAYYRARPFMPISTAGGTETAIAFHITILDDATAQQYGLNYLVRGFESHGCMRMREKDLMEFFTIVMKGADDKLPVEVDNHVPARDQHGIRDRRNGPTDETIVYPLETESYVRVTRFPEEPHFKRDDVEHLVIMDQASGQPNMRKLDDIAVNASDFDQQEPIDNRFPMP